MDLESSPKSSKKQPTTAFKEVLNSSKQASTTEASDPFSFVEKEMEKHQENDITPKKASPKTKKDSCGVASVNAKTENNPKPKVKPKVSRKNSAEEEKTRVLRNTVRSNAKATHSPNASPSRKNSPKEGVVLKNHNSTTPKAKNLRAAKLNSLEEKASSTPRHRSPSAGSKTQPKLKEQEAWTDNKMLTDSLEY